MVQNDLDNFALPTHLASFLVVVSLLSNPSETGSTQTMELQAKLLPFAVGHDVNVRLLSCVQKKKKISFETNS
jgi:hypothetical protein